jgi:hypothetical protein
MRHSKHPSHGVRNPAKTLTWQSEPDHASDQHDGRADHSSHHRHHHSPEATTTSPATPSASIVKAVSAQPDAIPVEAFFNGQTTSTATGGLAGTTTDGSVKYVIMPGDLVVDFPTQTSAIAQPPKLAVNLDEPACHLPLPVSEVTSYGADLDRADLSVFADGQRLSWASSSSFDTFEFADDYGIDLAAHAEALHLSDDHADALPSAPSLDTSCHANLSFIYEPFKHVDKTPLVEDNFYFA